MSWYTYPTFMISLHLLIETKKLIKRLNPINCFRDEIIFIEFYIFLMICGVFWNFFRDFLIICRVLKIFYSWGFVRFLSTFLQLFLSSNFLFIKLFNWFKNLIWYFHPLFRFLITFSNFQNFFVYVFEFLKIFFLIIFLNTRFFLKIWILSILINFTFFPAHHFFFFTS